MLPRVTVKKGLSFACPRCGAMAYLAVPWIKALTLPPGHELYSSRLCIIICNKGKKDLPWLFRLVINSYNE